MEYIYCIDPFLCMYILICLISKSIPTTCILTLFLSLIYLSRYPKGLFCRSDIFHSLNGFPKIDLMEDFEFVRMMKKANYRLSIIPVTSITSGRRWKKLGLIRTTLLNQVSQTNNQTINHLHSFIHSFASFPSFPTDDYWSLFDWGIPCYPPQMVLS